MATDLSNISTEALEIMARKQTQPTQQPTQQPQPEKLDLSSISTEAIEASLNSVENKPIGMRILHEIGQSPVGKALGEAGQFIDKFTGAPTRAAIGAIQDDDPKTGLLSAFSKQFGEDPKLAPTGKDIASKAGLSIEEDISIPGFGKVSSAGIAGLVVDIAADPTNIIPVGAIAKGTARVVGKGAKVLSKPALKGSAAAADFLKKTRPGKVATTITKATGEIAEDITNAIGDVLNPKINPKKDELFSMAEKYGLDTNILPESLEFGKNSPITTLARARNEGPLGEIFIENFNESVNGLNRAFDNQLDEIAGGVKPATKADAGKLIEQGYENARKSTFDQVTQTYKKIATENPGLKLSEDIQLKLNDKLVNNFLDAKKTSRLAKSAATETAGKRIQKSAAQIASSDGDYFELVEQLQAIGDELFDPKITKDLITKELKQNRDLYGFVKDALIEQAKRIDPKVGQELIESNKIMSDFFTDSSTVAQKINKGMAPEKIFESLVLRGDTKTIDNLRRTLSPEDFNPLKAAYLDFSVARQADGSVPFGTLQRNLQRNKHVVDEIFGQEVQGLYNVGEIIKLRDAMGSLKATTSGARESLVNIAKKVSISATDKQLLEQLKNKARNSANKLGVSPGLSGAVESTKQGLSGAVLGTQSKGILNTIKGLRRGKIEKATKLGQLKSIQETNESNEIVRRLKRDK